VIIHVTDHVMHSVSSLSLDPDSIGLLDNPLWCPYNQVPADPFRTPAVSNYGTVETSTNTDHLLNPVSFEQTLLQLPINNYAVDTRVPPVGKTTCFNYALTDEDVAEPADVRPQQGPGQSYRTRNNRRPYIYPTNSRIVPIKHTAAVFERSDGRFFCSEIGCDASYLRAGDCRRHMRKHEKPRFKCPAMDCDKTFYRADKMRDHIRQGHKGLFV
jgi:hypothetical protein